LSAPAKNFHLPRKQPKEKLGASRDKTVVIEKISELVLPGICLKTGEFSNIQCFVRISAYVEKEVDRCDRG
jgi:hypothetical protein